MDDMKREYEKRLEEKKKRQEEEETDIESGETEEEDSSEGQFDAEMLGSLHDNMDMNKDGKVSMQEIVDFNRHLDAEMAGNDAANIMQGYDKDEDGFVSLKEYTADDENADLDDDPIQTVGENGVPEDLPGFGLRPEERLEMSTNMFKAADDDGNDMLTEEEFKGLIHPELNHKVLLETVKLVVKDRDTNEDGKLSFQEYFEHPEESFGPEETQLDESKLAWDNYMNLTPYEQQILAFRWLDKDKDNALDPHEVLRWESGEFNLHRSFGEIFKHADIDKDGHITKKEFQDAQPQIVQSEAHEMMRFWNEHLGLQPTDAGEREQQEL